jgi:hypothetical protein
MSVCAPFAALASMYSANNSKAATLCDVLLRYRFIYLKVFVSEDLYYTVHPYFYLDMHIITFVFKGLVVKL